MSAPPPGAPSVWNVANGLTVLRVLLVPPFGWLLLSHGGSRPGWRLGAVAVFAVAMATDRFDGELARRRGLITDFGKIADPVADKALIGMALLGLSLLGLVPWWITVVIMTREVGITALRFAVIRHGVMPAGRGGKLKTVLQAVAIGLYLLPLPAVLAPLALVMLYAALVVTTVTGVEYVVDAVRLVRRSRVAGSPVASGKSRAD